jgi:hypothetical protein
MLGSPLLVVMIFMLIFSTNFESPLKTTAQIDAKTAATQLQPSSDQNQTDLGLTETSKIIEDGNRSMRTILKLLSNIIETRLNKSATLLEFTSKLPEVTNISYANSITERFMGIPQDLDLQKRNVARDILEQDKDIASIFFLTPKGDVYLGEPYPDQQQLPKLNFANRDWYKGVTSTNDTYTSAAFLSAAIHVPAIAIAVPVYGNSMEGNVSQDVTNTSQSVVGHWIGIMNLTKIKEDLSALDLLSHKDEVILVDHNGTQVFNILIRTINASSPSSFDNQSLKSYSQLQSVKNALDGKSGITIEMLNDNRKTVYYYPVQSQPHKWALLLLQPS